VTSSPYRLKLLKRKKSITFPGAKKITEKEAVVETL
jgi:hypothetical protein